MEIEDHALVFPDDVEQRPSEPDRNPEGQKRGCGASLAQPFAPMAVVPLGQRERFVEGSVVVEPQVAVPGAECPPPRDKTASMPASPAGDVVAALRKAAQHLMHEVSLAFRCVGQYGSLIEKQADDIVRRAGAFDDQLAYATPDRLDPSEANVEGNAV